MAATTRNVSVETGDQKMADALEHRVLVDVGQALLKREEGGWILHHRRQKGLVLSPEIRIAHG